MNNDTLAIIGLVAVAVLIVAAKIRSRRERREFRKLDFSKCDHNQPHTFNGESYEDSFCCDICGRPYNDPIHR